MPILGLASTESYTSERFKNVRRSVFYYYPNGAAPMTGLLSLQDKEEHTDDPEFSWWEKRMSDQRALTVSIGGSAGPFGASGGGAGAAAADFEWTADSSYRVHVDSTDVFRKQHVVRILALDNTGVTRELFGVVEVVSGGSSPKYITVRASNTVADIINDTTNENVGQEVWIIGNIAAQGVVDLAGEVYQQPVEFGNYTQIFRTPFSMTGTALKTSLKYDTTGPYKDKAKEHSINHMIELEKTFLFGRRHKYVPSGSADPTTGAGLPVYHTGGILWFLTEWERADSPYRGGVGAPALTLDTEDDKRIITNASGLLDEDAYDTHLEKLFRTTNNTSNEKLCFCGSGALKVVNQLFRSKSVINTDMPMTDTYGMNVVRHLTPFGTIYYKTHPLFSQNPIWRHNMLFVDIGNMRYRPMKDRDTKLLKNRQPNDADYRKDEWFTDAGLELQRPESFMLLQNVRNYTP